MNDFTSLGVAQPLADALATRGISEPTPIQSATLPDSLAGRDVLGRGRTGSGKTFAFLLPVAQRLQGTAGRTAKQPRALVLAPTRELATQIDESLQTLEQPAGLNSLTIFGGVGQNPQVRALAKGVDVLIACPGRLLDLMGQGALDLSRVEVAVLDEADHMADMGFLPMVKKILDKVPAKAQKMLFSATLDNGIDAIAKRYLHSPVLHEADSPESPVARMDHHVLTVPKDDKLGVLADLAAAPGRTILFTRTKHGAKKLAKQLLAKGVPAVDLHGNLAQNARTRNLDAFHSGRVETLVATDIAARGIHVDDVELVVHADPPAEHKAYLHRSGRTARAGKAGTVVTLATPDQRQELRGLMRAAKIHPTVSDASREVLDDLAPGERTFLDADQAQQVAHPDREGQQPQQGRGGRGRGQRGGGRRGQGADEQHARAGGSDAATAGEGRRRRSRGGRGRGGAGERATTGRDGSQNQSGQQSRSSQVGGGRDSRAQGGRSGGQGRGGQARGGQRSRGEAGGSVRGGATTVYSTSSGSTHSAADFSRSMGRRGRR